MNFPQIYRTDQNQGRVISVSPLSTASSEFVFSSGPTNPPGTSQGAWTDWEGGVIYFPQQIVIETLIVDI